MNCSHHEHLFRHLSILHRYTRIYIHNRVAETDIECCHPPYLMCILHNEGMSQDELAKEFRIDKGSVAKTLRQMEEAGFVTREEDENDRRRYRIYLTNQGRETIPRLKDLADDTEAILTKDMTQEEITALRQLLEKATANILSVTEKGGNDCGSQVL